MFSAETKSYLLKLKTDVVDPHLQLKKKKKGCYMYWVKALISVYIWCLKPTIKRILKTNGNFLRFLYI